MTVRIEVRSNHPAAGQSVVRGAAALGIAGVTACQVVRLYFLEHDPGAEAIERLCNLLLVDPVTETWAVARGEPDGEGERGRGGHLVQSPNLRISNLPLPASPPLAPRPSPHLIEVAFRPGVTDVTARELKRGMVEIGLPRCEVTTGTRYELAGDLSPDDAAHAGAPVALQRDHPALQPRPHDRPTSAPRPRPATRSRPSPSDGLDDAELLALSQARLLSLDLAEMRTIQRFLRRPGSRRPPTSNWRRWPRPGPNIACTRPSAPRIDFTWQNADGSVIAAGDGRRPAQPVHPRRHRRRLARLAALGLCGQRRHHRLRRRPTIWPSRSRPTTTRRRWNPSAAPTPASAAWCATSSASRRGPSPPPTCSASARRTIPVDQVPDGVLHPRRIADGVVAGIGDYGNKLGLPTVNGAVIYDEGYLGNPLVFCGCAGLLPHGSHPDRGAGRRSGRRTGRPHRARRPPRRHLLLGRADPRDQRDVGQRRADRRPHHREGADRADRGGPRRATLQRHHRLRRRRLLLGRSARWAKSWASTSS